MGFEVLKPYDWPQDDLDIPAGHGVMPPLSAGNVMRSRRESFTMSGQINLPTLTPGGTKISLTIPTDQDGDFWCNQIYAEGMRINAGIMFADAPMGRVAIEDIRTGLTLTYPADAGIPYNLLIGGAPSDVIGFDLNSTPFPAGYRPTATLIQPHCFTRQGGIKLDYTLYTTINAADSFVLSFVFGGWKEYAYASR